MTLKTYVNVANAFFATTAILLGATIFFCLWGCERRQLSHPIPSDVHVISEAQMPDDVRDKIRHHMPGVSVEDIQYQKIGSVEFYKMRYQDDDTSGVIQVHRQVAEGNAELAITISK